MALFDYRIAAGYNVALGSLTNIESITVAGYKFRAPQVYGTYNPGDYRYRGDGTVYQAGYASVVWKFGALTRGQYEYLRDTILSAAYSGKVTIYTRLGAATYTRMNAVMVLPKPVDTDGLFYAYKAVDVLMTRLAAAS